MRNLTATQIEALLGRGKFASALTALNTNSWLDSELPEKASIYKARALKGLEKYEQAKPVYQQLLEEQSAQIAALIGLADIALSENNTEEAISLINRVESLEPDNPDVGILNAKMSIAEQNYEQAESLLSDTLIKLPNADTLDAQKSHHSQRTLRSPDQTWPLV